MDNIDIDDYSKKIDIDIYTLEDIINYGLSIAALICSLLGYTTFIGLILGIIVLNSNKGKNNSAKTMGLISVIISSVVLFIGFLFIVSQ